MRAARYSGGTMQRPSRRRPSLPQVDVEPGSPQARNSNSKSDVTAAEPRTPRGTDIIVRKTGGPTDLLDSFLNAFHAAPIGFVFIVVLSFFTRFWQLKNPAGVVFDESHFGGFTENYLHGRYFFDIHPPLGKLTMAWYAHFAGYKHGICDYESNTMYSPKCQYWILREAPAFFGALLAPLVYGVAREVGSSRMTATFTAMLIIVDTYNIMEARCVLTDSQVIFYCVLCFYVALRWWRRLNDPTPMTPVVRWAWVFLMGLVCGASISVKWTGLASPGMVAVESFFAIWFLKKPAKFVDLVVIAVLAMAQYHMWWAFHFWMLPNTGPEAANMPIEYQRTLIGNAHYDPKAPFPSFLPLMWGLNRDMLVGSASISTPHRWESKYYQWVLNTRGLLYYGEPFGPQPGLWSAMYLVGNPLIVWGCGIAIVVYLLSVLIHTRYWFIVQTEASKAISQTHRVCCYLFLGWLFNLLPYLAVTRQAFCYHYIPGLFYAQVLLPRYLQGVLPWKLQPVVFWILGIAFCATFVFYMPWIYSLPLTPDGHEMRRWLKTWD